MAELLQCLPEDSKYRPRILKGYRKMMKSLKKYQTSDGLWNQLIDQPDCWAETSGSAMFTFAFITGVKQGWLKAKEYGPAARKAWMALVPYINEKNDVREVCVGTNKRIVSSIIMIALVIPVIITVRLLIFGVRLLFWKNNGEYGQLCPLLK